MRERTHVLMIAAIHHEILATPCWCNIAAIASKSRPIEILSRMLGRILFFSMQWLPLLNVGGAFRIYIMRRQINVLCQLKVAVIKSTHGDAR